MFFLLLLLTNVSANTKLHWTFLCIFCQWSNWMMIGKVCQVRTICSDLWCLYFPPRILFTNQPKTRHLIVNHLESYHSVQNILIIWVSMEKHPSQTPVFKIFNSGSKNESRCIMEKFKSARMEKKFNDWGWNMYL